MLSKEIIQEKIRSGWTYQQIGEFFGVSRQRIHQVVKGYSTIQNKNLLKVIRFESKCTLEMKCRVGSKLHVHHFDGNSKNNRADNLIILCSPCHKFVHSLMDGADSKRIVCHKCKLSKFSYEMHRFHNMCKECNWKEIMKN